VQERQIKVDIKQILFISHLQYIHVHVYQCSRKGPQENDKILKISKSSILKIHNVACCVETFDKVQI
jgi:hypothetical protein